MKIYVVYVESSQGYLGAGKKGKDYYYYFKASKREASKRIINKFEGKK